MKEFDPVSLLATAREFLGAWTWALAVLTVFWLVLVVMAVRRDSRGQPCCIALLIGAIAWIASVVALPTLTDSAFRYVNGVADWAILLMAGAGVGIAAAVLAWPLIRLAHRNR